MAVGKAVRPSSGLAVMYPPEVALRPLAGLCQANCSDVQQLCSRALNPFLGYAAAVDKRFEPTSWVHTHRRRSQRRIVISDEVNSKVLGPALALTAIGADIETRGATP
jgi:hypothetical protein